MIGVFCVQVIGLAPIGCGLPRIHTASASASCELLMRQQRQIVSPPIQQFARYVIHVTNTMSMKCDMLALPGEDQA